MNQKRVYTEEYKRDAVRLAAERGNLSQTSRELGIHNSVLGRWKRQIEQEKKDGIKDGIKDGSYNPFPGNGNPRDQELAQMTRELHRLKEENEILKKAVGIFTTRPR